jgi:hypothetical protein
METVQGFVGSSQVSIFDHFLEEVAILFKTLTLVNILTQFSLTILIVE